MMVATPAKTKRPQSLAEQQKSLALLECLARPENILRRDVALPASIAANLEQTVNSLASLMFDEHMQQHP